MGCFSWMFCDVPDGKRDGRRLIIGRRGYLLIPKEFGGGHLAEERYNGYGVFRGKDAYELAAVWNREYMASHPEYAFSENDGRIADKPWYKLYADMSIPAEELDQRLKEELKDMPYMELRWIGIELACYDKDNAALPYPIKIAKDEQSVYEDYGPSKADPMQGCF